MRGWLSLLAVLFGCLLGVSPALAQTAAGEWNGAIIANAAVSLHVAVHIKQAADGSYSGTFDSLDQGVNDLPIASITVSGDTLSFVMKAPVATYTGTWDPAAKAWVGHWNQNGAALPLTLAAGAPAVAPTLKGLDGDWGGVLGGKLHLVLHVHTTAQTGTIASLDSIDQLSYGMTINAIHRDGLKVSFEMTGVGASFAGALAGDGQSIAGDWTQGGADQPLTFTRRAASADAVKRPQTPVKPYPYVEQDVTFEDAAAGVKLAGTLTLPKGPGPFPAVVLVAGSGPNTRDEPILGHQIFLVLADHLTRNGIAVLRYDKRGTGDSAGDYAAATTLDFAHDADAAAAYLRSRPEVDARHVGLIGHSEGGLIVPMVATEDPATAFIVMMAGPGVDGEKILLEQGRLIAKAMGMTDEQVKETSALRKEIFDIVGGQQDATVAAGELTRVIDDYAASHKLPPSSIESQVGQVNSDWFRYFFHYDPAATLAKVRCPVLALNGSLDLQVPPAQNLPAVRAALAGNPDAEVDELPGLNHLFQPATTGSPGEYAQIETTIDPGAMDLMTKWILKHVGAH